MTAARCPLMTGYLLMTAAPTKGLDCDDDDLGDCDGGGCAGG
jgi:hypothetical protein